MGQTSLLFRPSLSKERRILHGGLMLARLLWCVWLRSIVSSVSSIHSIKHLCVGIPFATFASADVAAAAAAAATANVAPDAAEWGGLLSCSDQVCEVLEARGMSSLVTTFGRA